MPTHIKRQDYRDRVLGCWLGKNIGGTLGAPFEWRRQVNEVDFYTQDLHGEPLPNDDLDIQLLWLVALEERGLELNAACLAEYWCTYVTPHWSEYGTAKINMRAGLPPPLCGTVGNDFRDSCGAFIRSEIWACIAPGMPGVAAKYARRDGMLDHGDGEGTHAEVFCAALESAAFVCADLGDLIDIALSYIPPDCGVAQAVALARRCADEGIDWRDARHQILAQHRGSPLFGHAWACSAADRAAG
ncbi:MAG: ADP-ribosylglycohydrolase family protein, partial [Planctomycetota bacterium]|nr:ADP-ribosylglycohydrolase family protein [Planctomycetota bacterium]